MLRDLGELSPGFAVLEVAIGACKGALRGDTRNGGSIARAYDNMSLGATLIVLGKRSQDSRQLEEAVRALTTALDGLTADRNPKAWRTIQFNLGHALLALGLPGNDAESLKASVQAFEEGLGEFSKDAGTHQGWSSSYLLYGLALGGLRLHERAIGAFEMALVTNDSEGANPERADIYDGLGSSLLALDAETPNPVLLLEASSAFANASRWFANNGDAVGFADAEMWHGLTLVQLWYRVPRIEYLEEAVDALNAALDSEARTVTSLRGYANRKLGDALALISELNSDPTRREDAIRAYIDGLDIVARDQDANEWALLQYGLANTLASATAACPEMTRLEQAAVAYQQALTSLDPDGHSETWGSSQHGLGCIYADLGEGAGDVPMLEDAVRCFQAALGVRDRATAPLQWAYTQANLGSALAALGRHSGNIDHLMEASRAYDRALEVLESFEDAEALRDIRWGRAQNLTQIAALSR